MRNKQKRYIISNNNNNSYCYYYNNNSINNNVLLVSIIKLVGGCGKKISIRVSKLRMNKRDSFIHLNRINRRVIHYKNNHSNKKKCLIYGLCGVSLVIPDMKIGFMVGLWLSSKEMFKLRLFKICEYIRSKVLRVKLIGFVRGYL